MNDINRNHHRLAVIYDTIIEANANWHRDPNKSYDTKKEDDKSHCLKCDATEVTYGNLNMRLTWGDIEPQTFRFCNVCYPELAATFTEWNKRQIDQRERTELSRVKRQYHESMIAELKSIGPVFQKAYFRNYIPQNQSQAHALDQCRKWAGSKESREKFPFLVLQGPIGTGKTHLAQAICRRITHRDRIPTFTKEVAFSSEWQKAEYNERTEVVDRLRVADILVIDDLGKVKATEAWGRALYEIIDYRWCQALPTLLTSNGNLSSVMWASTADRIYSPNNLIIILEGTSMRCAA